MEPYALWLAAAGAAGVAELLSSTLVSVWFAAGALAAFAVALAGGPLWAQLAAFAGVSVACILVLRPIALRHRPRGAEPDAAPVGETALVVEAIAGDGARGRVETGDRMTWAAVSATGEAIEAGAAVRVVACESVKLVVERID